MCLSWFFIFKKNRLSNPLYLEVKLKLHAPEMSLTGLNYGKHSRSKLKQEVGLQTVMDV